MVYLKSVENVITLGKLIGLLFLFCLLILSILFLKTKRNDLARPVMGNIFFNRRSGRACIYEKPCLLFASAITKSSLDVRPNDKAHAHQITFTFARPLMGTIF